MRDAAIDPARGIPLYRQLEAYLRELIMQKEYQDGKLLPGETELAQNLGVSRNTLRTAMDKLVSEGLIMRKQGVGTIVNKAKIRTTLEKWNGFSDEMRSKGLKVQTVEQKVTWVEADRDIAFELGAREGRSVCCLTRLRAVDEKPAVLFISYFPAHLHIRQDENFDGKLYDILDRRYGVTPEVSDEEISAMACAGWLSRKLDIDRGAPVLLRKRKVFAADGRLLELCYAYYRADQFVYSVKMRKEKDQA